jgi:hypothetical protein
MAIYINRETGDIFNFISSVSSSDEILNKRLKIVKTEKIKSYKGNSTINVYEVFDDYFESTFFLHDCKSVSKDVILSIFDSNNGKVYITNEMGINLIRLSETDLFNYIIGREFD